MPNKQSSSKKGSRNTRLSARTRKQIDSLPIQAQHIYKKTHDSAVEQYQDPEKRRGGRKQSTELAAHKVAWAAVKTKYKKQGDRWLRKEQ
ncbi:MAG TPA: ChaB family protein [Nitrososphaeraceae archaeon]|nr:ChaB family protein [Nitrososphaeraceae archaeon]